MAIATIQTPNQTANPLQQILAGQATITNFLDKAFQQSRDQVNNQYRQDAQLVQSMQLAQGLSQRRSQDLDQRLIDQRNFDYRKDQDAIQLGLREQQIADNRDARLFNQGLDTQKFGFAQDQANVGNTLRQQQLDATIANQNVDNANSAGQLQLMQNRDAREQGIFNQFGTTKPPTRADARADERLQMTKDNAAVKTSENRFKSMVEGDTSAFVPQQMFVGPEPEANADAKTVNDYQKRLALAQRYDKNAFESELESARNVPLDQYVKNIPNPTPTAIRKRREFWQYANQASPSDSTNTPQPGEIDLNF